MQLQQEPDSEQGTIDNFGLYFADGKQKPQPQSTTIFQNFADTSAGFGLRTSKTFELPTGVKLENGLRLW